MTLHELASKRQAMNQYLPYLEITIWDEICYAV